MLSHRARRGAVDHRRSDAHDRDRDSDGDRGGRRRDPREAVRARGRRAS